MPGVNVASNDSEEATSFAQMSGRITSIDGAPDQGSQDQENQRQHQQYHNQHHPQAPVSGHLVPAQRRLYLGLLTMACCAALAGLTLLFVWMYKHKKVPGIGLSDPDQLANLHPIMMYLFMVSLNMYAVLVYRTHFRRAKEQLKWGHAIISGVNIVMSVLGVVAMYISHNIKGQANFYSLHSWIGVTTNAFYLSQFALGFVAFLRPGTAQHIRAALMPWHRFMGAALLVLAALAAITGMAELVIFQGMPEYTSFSPITFVANLAGMSVLLMTAIAIYLLTAPQFLRPRLPEEEPLKR